MNGIEVVTRSPTPAGRLLPRYDEVANILVLESPEQREWPYGIDVDGRIIFDIDDERVLANCDLHIGRDRWESDAGMDWPSDAQAGDILFSLAAVETKTFSLPLRVTLDRAQRRVRIEIGTLSPDRFVALAERCIACISKGQLAGFFVQL